MQDPCRTQGRARQNSSARAGRNFTQPCTKIKSHLCRVALARKVLRSHLILIHRLTHERMDSQERLSYEINLPESKETKVLRAAKKISLRVIILCQPFAGGPTAPQPTPTTLPLSGLFLINLRDKLCLFLLRNEREWGTRGSDAVLEGPRGRYFTSRSVL